MYSRCPNCPRARRPCVVVCCLARQPVVARQQLTVVSSVDSHDQSSVFGGIAEKSRGSAPAGCWQTSFVVTKAAPTNTLPMPRRVTSADSDAAYGMLAARGS
jgi:hypothetical protein